MGNALLTPFSCLSTIIAVVMKEKRWWLRMNEWISKKFLINSPFYFNILINT